MLLRKAFWLALLAALVTAVPLWAQGPAAKPTGGAGAAREEAPADSDASAGDAGDESPPAEGASDGAEGSAPPGDADAEAGSGADSAAYVRSMRELEQRVDQLKDQIRLSHTRLSLLSETILARDVGGARAEIRFSNDTSSAFRLQRLLVVLDGAVQFSKEASSGRLAKKGKIRIFSGFIPPGDHTLQVLVQLRGHGYGVFSYLRGYRFELKSAHSFTVTEGKTIDIDIIAWEKGGVTVPLEQRPAIRYVEKLRSGGVTGTKRARRRQAAKRREGKRPAGGG